MSIENPQQLKKVIHKPINYEKRTRTQGMKHWSVLFSKETQSPLDTIIAFIQCTSTVTFYLTVSLTNNLVQVNSINICFYETLITVELKLEYILLTVET